VSVTISSERDWPASALVAARLVTFGVIGAALYLGQAVLVPLVLAALVTARQTRWSYALILPVVFSVYHTSYGLGFLLALTRHLSGRATKPAAGFATGLTR